MPDPVVIAAYDPRWPTRFAQLRDRLAPPSAPWPSASSMSAARPSPAATPCRPTGQPAPPGSPPHHLYVCPAGSPVLARHLALRDRLRADPAAARAYADLKRALADRFRNDRVAYTDAKTAFIDALLAGSACP